MHRALLKIGLSLLPLLPVSGSSADVYRWVDAQGQVHFEDRSQAQSDAGVSSYKPPTAAPEDRERRMDKTRKLLNAYQVERQQAREQQQKEQQAQADRDRRCALARDDLRQYQQYGAIYRLGDDGARVYLSDDERAALIARLRGDIARWCR